MIKCKTMVMEEEEMETIMDKHAKSSNVPKIANQPLENEAYPIVKAQKMKMKEMPFTIAERKKLKRRKQCQAPKF